QRTVERRDVQMRRHLLVVCAVLALLSAACGGNDDNGDNGDSSSGTDGGGAQTYTVGVDAKSPDVPIGTTAYFPAELKVAAGDTVDFKSVFTGEPHTVTLGTL